MQMSWIPLSSTINSFTCSEQAAVHAHYSATLRPRVITVYFGDSSAGRRPALCGSDPFLHSVLFQMGAGAQAHCAQFGVGADTYLRLTWVPRRQGWAHSGMARAHRAIQLQLRSLSGGRTLALVTTERPRKTWLSEDGVRPFRCSKLGAAEIILSMTLRI
jgi:hypothetical protein